MYRFVPNKLLEQFSRYTGNLNWSFRFSQNESNSFVQSKNTRPFSTEIIENLITSNLSKHQTMN